MSFYIFLLAVAALGAFAYVALFLTHVPGASDERLGVLEPLPDGFGKWVKARQSSAEGLEREERYLFADGKAGGAKLVLQVRFRDPKTREIIRVEPERVVRRRRVRA